MRQFVYFILSIWILLSACNDPILIGSVLLEDEALDVEFTDGLDVTAKTILSEEPSITFRDITGGVYSAVTYMVGSMEDPIFGKSESATYFSPILLSEYPDFSEYTLDSVVIIIPYDSIGFYGDLNAIHNLELRAISESLQLLSESDPKDTLYSNQTVAVDPLVLSSLSAMVTYKDSTVIKPYNEIDTVIKVAPQLRMQLDVQPWIDLAGSTTDTLSTEDLEAQVFGYELKSTPSTSSMIGLDLYYNGFSTEANINFYYNIGDSIKTIYQMPLGRYRHSHFTNDYTGSEVANSLDDVMSNELYAQSQAGTIIEVDLSSVNSIGDKILNYAELELTVVPEDEELYQPITAIYPWYKNEDGELELVGLPATDIPLDESYAGGSRTLSYPIDLTTHISLIKKGDITNNKIFLIPTIRAQRPNRSIILGTNHPEQPLKLNLILTKP